MASDKSVVAQYLKKNYFTSESQAYSLRRGLSEESIQLQNTVFFPTVSVQLYITKHVV